MSTEQIITLLTEERDRLNRAIDVLGGVGKPRRGRPPGKKKAGAAPAAAATEAASEGASKAAPAKRKKRKLSAAARARISEAQKKRWAAARQ